MTNKKAGFGIDLAPKHAFAKLNGCACPAHTPTQKAAFIPCVESFLSVFVVVQAASTPKHSEKTSFEAGAVPDPVVVVLNLVVWC